MPSNCIQSVKQRASIRFLHIEQHVSDHFRKQLQVLIDFPWSFYMISAKDRKSESLALI